MKIYEFYEQIISSYSRSFLSGFLQPDVWSTCLFRPIFATWLSRTRFHLHIDSHRRMPDAKSQHMAICIFIFFPFHFVQYGVAHQFRTLKPVNESHQVPCSELNFCWRVKQNGDTTVGGRLSGILHNFKSGRSHYVAIIILMLKLNSCQREWVCVRAECVREE